MCIACDNTGWQPDPDSGADQTCDCAIGRDINDRLDAEYRRAFEDDWATVLDNDPDWAGDMQAQNQHARQPQPNDAFAS